ncbi:hypothetical protein Tco_0400326 [Tanacetum coccineum]
MTELKILMSSKISSSRWKFKLSWRYSSIVKKTCLYMIEVLSSALVQIWYINTDQHVSRKEVSTEEDYLGKDDQLKIEAEEESDMASELIKFIKSQIAEQSNLYCDGQHGEHAEFDESDTHVLERFDTSAGNPVKEILPKLNLPDHRSILTDSKEFIKMDMERRSVKVKELQERCIIKAFQDHQIKKGMSMCSRSHSRQAKEQAQDLKSMITTSIHKLMIEAKDYELKTKVKA